MENEKKLRSFGLMMGVIFVLIALVLVYKEKHMSAGFMATIGGGFLLAGFWKPLCLAGIYRRWMRFAEIIGKFNTKVILGLFFLLIFPVVRLFFFLFRKDPLNRKFDPNKESYWEDREPIEKSLKDYERQF